MRVTEMKAVREGYKMTELGEIPNDWNVISIGELADIRRGASPRPIRDPKWFSDAPNVGWIRISDVTKSKKYLQETDQYLSPLGVEKSRLLTPGDLIMSICGTIGRPVILSINACIHDGFVVFNNINKEQLDTNFMLYVLVRLEKYFKGQGQPGTQVNLNTSIVEKTLIALPSSIIEQQKIAEILSTVDEQIENNEKLIKETKVLKKGLMQKLFTQGIKGRELKETEIGEIPVNWEVSLLDNIAERKSGHTPNKKVDSYWNGSIPWISLKDLSKLDKRYISETTDYTTIEGIDNSSAVLLPPGTIVISRDATVGKVGITQKEMATSQHFINYICNTELNNYFLYYYLFFKKKTFERIATGSTIKTIGLGFFKELKIIVPPLEEQQKIADILSSVDEQIENYEQEKVKYIELKKGLMQQLLTGKLRVTV